MVVAKRSGFRKGEVVQLKSGGPRMTIHSISGQEVGCTWFKGLTLQAATFDPETLMRVAVHAAGRMLPKP